MPKDNYRDCIKEFEEAQETESDNRELAKAADIFLNRVNGQWEDSIYNKLDGKPRYTFDECSPIVDDIMGELQNLDFDIRVNPAGDDASKDTAEAYEGIIRNIENISDARFIYSGAARQVVSTGIAGWRVVNDFRDDDSFQQDLLIKPLHNFTGRVWFDPNFMERTASDADFCWIINSMTKKKYDEKYPKGSGISITPAEQNLIYLHKKPDEVLICEYLYRKTQERELAQMSNGAVFVVDDAFKIVIDELQQAGITVVRTRKRLFHTVYQRIFDGDDWLTDETKTIFNLLPVIPVFGNFQISENKVIYRGAVEKMKDAQRVINYSESRKIEEGALSPRPKTWMTKEQALGDDIWRTLRTLNTNADPVQFYKHVDGQPPPYYHGVVQANPILIESTQAAQNFIQRASSTFDESRGKAPAGRSGAAIDLLQSKSDSPKQKWVEAMEIALTQTFRVLVKAIPEVYKTPQQLRIIGQDGTSDKITIKERIIDQQTGKTVELLDLSKGSYDVICTAGPAFHSRQQETVQAINELAAIDPSIMQIGADILLNNINAPGVDQIAERKRAMMVSQGLIPPQQLTREEMAQIQQQQAQQQGQPPSALDQANLMIAQAQLEETQGRNQERALKLQLEEQNLMLKQMDMRFKSDAQQQKLMIDSIKAVSEQVKVQAEALKTIREAMGADSIISQTVAQAYEGQARDLAQTIAEN